MSRLESVIVREVYTEKEYIGEYQILAFLLSSLKLFFELYGYKLHERLVVEVGEVGSHLQFTF